ISGAVLTKAARAVGNVVEQIRLPATGIQLQERPVFAVVILVQSEQIKDGAQKLQLCSFYTTAQLAAGFNEILIIQAGSTEIGIQQTASTVQMQTAWHIVWPPYPIKPLHSKPCLRPGSLRRWY